MRSTSIAVAGLAAVTGLSLPTAAQATTTIPSRYASSESPSVGMVAGFNATFRQQILVTAGQLAGIRDRSIRAIVVRRDRNDGYPLRSSRARLTVHLSTTAVTPATASTLFAANRGGDRSLAFSGTVSLPAAPATTGVPPWTVAHTARIPIAGGFPYRSGTLCIEIDGEPLDRPAYWPVDYSAEVAFGTVNRFGTACGFPTTMVQETADATRDALMIGGTVNTFAFGRPGTSSVVLIGTKLASSIGLDALGAPGCAIHVQPALSLTATHGPAYPEIPAGRAEIPLHLPMRVGLAGGTLYLQWANLDARANRLGITTTNGVELAIATQQPSGSFATIESRIVSNLQNLPAAGLVRMDRMPVLQIEYQ